MTSIPYVIEKGPKDQERSYDLYSRMLKDRIIFIKGEFDQHMADAVVAQLLFLESQDPDADIMIYINSPGGSVTAMFAIYDVMQYIKCDIVTIAYGMAASAASMILMAGTKGKRYALPSASIMIHEMAGGFSGKAKDMRNQWENLDKLDKKLNKMISDFTGQKLKKVEKDVKLDYYMSSEEAVEYGIIDKVHFKRG
jgi:ATP-dependent Clp protease protease subunit